MNTRGSLGVTVLVAGLLLGVPVARGVETQAIKLPETIQDHQAMATSYEQKAAAYRQEAAYHRAMLEKAAEAERINPKAQVHPRYEAMRKHCEPIIRDAEQLASDMSEFAKWHRMRAAELEGR